MSIALLTAGPPLQPISFQSPAKLRALPSPSEIRTLHQHVLGSTGVTGMFAEVRRSIKDISTTQSAISKHRNRDFPEIHLVLPPSATPPMWAIGKVRNGDHS